MTHPNHADLHAEHRLWKTDHACWQEDLEGWRAECEKALHDAERVADLIREHRKALDSHARAVQQHEATLHGHERAMAVAESSGTDRPAAELAAAHRAQARRHAVQRDTHEQIKRHHHVLLAKVAVLLRALERGD